MLRACYGNRSDRCWLEAFTSSAEFVAVQRPLSLHFTKGYIMLNHDQQTAAAWFSHFTQINGSFQSSWTQKGIPWLRRKELLDYFFPSCGCTKTSCEYERWLWACVRENPDLLKTTYWKLSAFHNNKNIQCYVNRMQTINFFMSSTTT